jgi:hypothetical protein
MKVNNIVVLIPYQPPEPGYGPDVEVIAYDERHGFNFLPMATLKEPAVRMSEKMGTMSSRRKIRQ